MNPAPQPIPSASPEPAPPSAEQGSRLPLLRSERGLTLIEVLVSALMVVLIAAAAARALISTSQASADQRFRSQADAIASQDQERLRGLSDQQLNQLDSASQTRSVTLNGLIFHVTSSSSYLDTTGNTSCTSTAAAYYKVTSSVTWQESPGASPAPLTEQSILSRPVSGDLPAVVTDQTGKPLAGVDIQASGPSNQSGTTDGSGCVLFAGLTPGSYTLDLTDSGYVDPNGNSASPLTATTSVTGSGTATQTFHLGLGGSLTGNFTASSGSGTANGEADGISWSGTGSSYGMSAPGTAPSAPSAPTTTQSTLSLFPFSGSSGYTDNYTVWAGRCPQQEPPAPTDEFTVAPGSTQTQPIQEPLLDLGATYNGTSTKPSDVKMTFTSLSGASCTDTWNPTVASSASSTTGWLQNPGQPYADGTTGQLTVCADYKVTTTTTKYGHTTTTTTYYKATAQPTNASFTSPNTVTLAVTNTSGSTGSC